jgi:hypothetical protein
MSSNRIIHSVCASQENKYGKKYSPKGVKREFVATFGWIIARSTAFTLRGYSNISGVIAAKVTCIKIHIMEANKMHYFSNLFDKQLYMFRTDLLSIISSLDTIFTASAICDTTTTEKQIGRRQHSPHDATQHPQPGQSIG